MKRKAERLIARFAGRRNVGGRPVRRPDKARAWRQIAYSAIPAYKASPLTHRPQQGIMPPRIGHHRRASGA